MTIFQYTSDLHLEFIDNTNYIAEQPLGVEGDILLLAGNIILLGDLSFASSFYLVSHPYGILHSFS